MSLYSILKAHQGKTHYLDCEEFRYFSSNSQALVSIPSFEHFLKPEDTFDIVRANILIRGLFAKKKMDEALKEAASFIKKNPGFDLSKHLDEAKKGLPYLLVSGVKIYVPFLPKSANRLYDQSPEKLLQRPYDTLIGSAEGLLSDAFETYSTPLFESLFTRLCPVYHGSGGQAFYDVDAERLYFVNSQGRLDAMVCYFDKYLIRPSRTRIIERSIPVARAYYDFDRGALIRALSENRLVSGKILHKVQKERLKR